MLGGTPATMQLEAMTKARSLDDLAEEILSRLAQYDEASEIVLGGYFALQQYIDYRETHDIDAWWRSQASSSVEERIRTVMEEVGAVHGMHVRERRFGDTASFELLEGNKKRFSFQISLRSVTLEEPLLSAWPPIHIESVRENVASKMNALVNRGAPRDFLDIRRVCTEGLVSVALCWELWQQKNRAGEIDSAKQNILLHLKRLEARRPIDQIMDSGERAEADELRGWFRRTFLA